MAKSTHAGIPWLRHIRRRRPQLHFWPFDGWLPAIGASVIFEAYPRLWNRKYPAADRTPDQHDAYSVATWLQEADLNGALEQALAPTQPETVATTAMVEGWILGATWAPRKKMMVKCARKSANRSKTTQPGYINRNGQEVLSRTGLPGNDHNQVIYILRCLRCDARYGANGSDIFQRRCPICDGGRPGLQIE